MAVTFYFFDLETSGFRADSDRIMQFAGQRTDMDLKPIGKPDNILVKLSQDILPQPEAVLVHGITPQVVNRQGISEAELAKYLINEVFIPDTIAVGYNNIRFDNNFIRFLMWRTFYDPYEWSWKNGCSSWDLLDVVRMTRALRPDGIEWPFDSEGRPSNKLELLSSVNQLEHSSAHDALSDVQAAIALARLLKDKQPKIFDYLLKHRSKDKVAPLVNSGKPFIYTSGRYPSDWLKTTIAVSVAKHPEQNAALVYDLRIDPAEWADKSAGDLAKAWSAWGKDVPYFPVKKLRYNRCPATVADMRVLDKASQKRLGLHLEIIEEHLRKLQKYEDFGGKLVRALEIMDKPEQATMIVSEQEVDSALYKGFINDADKSKMRVVRAADPEEFSDLNLEFQDPRLNLLLPLYKARNFSSSLTAEEQKWWHGFRTQKLAPGLDDYFARIKELSASGGVTKPAKHLLQDLQDYAQAILPA